jgi:hypothetical protein
MLNEDDLEGQTGYITDGLEGITALIMDGKPVKLLFCFFRYTVLLAHEILECLLPIGE